MDRIAHTSAFVTPVVEQWVEREIVQWVHHEGSNHEWMLLARSYISLAVLQYVFMLWPLHTVSYERNVRVAYERFTHTLVYADIR